VALDRLQDGDRHLAAPAETLHEAVDEGEVDPFLFGDTIEDAAHPDAHARLGEILAEGKPDEIRGNQEVRDIYLGEEI